MSVNEIVIKSPKGIRKIGPSHPTFIIGEMSGNHNLDLNRAKKLVDVAIAAGVDAIKLQTYTADTLTIDSDKEYFQVKVNDAWKGQTLYSLYKTAYTPWEWHSELKNYAESKGVMLFSTPFDESAVDFLETLDVALYKIASFESAHIPLLKKVASTRKPVILSRGLTSLEDLERAIHVLKDNGAPQVAVLHCVSAYPAKPEQMNLRTIPDIAARFNVISGLSDHTMGVTIPIASVALGASVIEKHYTLARADGGPDSAFSLEADELKQLVDQVRVVEAALGKATYESGSSEKENIIFRRSIFVVKDIAKGEAFTSENVRIIRPGYGMQPRMMEEVLGKRASCSIERGTPLSPELIERI